MLGLGLLETWLTEAAIVKALLLAPFMARPRSEAALHGGAGRLQKPPPPPLLEAPVPSADDTGPEEVPEEPVEEADAAIPDRLKAPRIPLVAARLFARHMRDALPATPLRAADVWSIYRDWCARIEGREPLKWDNDFLDALAKLPTVRKEQVRLKNGQRFRMYTFGVEPVKAAEAPPEPAKKPSRKRSRRRARRR